MLRYLLSRLDQSQIDFPSEAQGHQAFKGLTPLMLAAMSSNNVIEKVKILLEYKADYKKDT